jgi:hypothetical protein
MKRTLLLIVAAGSGFVFGCGSSPQEVSKQLDKADKHPYQLKSNQESQLTPESIAAHAESARERANYLRGLENDAKFDAKQHVDMLKKYEGDPDLEVSAAAKQLLAKAQ